MSIVRLSEEDVLRIHDGMITHFGGEPGIRDVGTFKSQCVMPYQTFGGEDLFPDVYDKAVRYLFGFATNQVFFDGNKRTAVATMDVFLRLNGISLTATPDELSQMALRVANKQMNEDEVRYFLQDHTE